MVTYTWDSTHSNEKSVYDNLQGRSLRCPRVTDMLSLVLQIAYVIRKGKHNQGRTFFNLEATRYCAPLMKVIGTGTGCFVVNCVTN